MMRTVNADRFAEKRAEILEAAGRCFMRSGFHGGSISAICAEAGISPGHLYHYFENKEAIVSALVQDRLKSATKRYQLLVNMDAIVPSFLAEIEDYLRRERWSGFTFQKMMLSDILGEASRNPAIAAMFADFSRQRNAYAADWLRKGQAAGQVDPSLDPEGAAAVLISSLDAAGTWPIRDPEFDFEKNFAVLRTMLTRLLTPPADDGRPSAS
jgi:TetR/AcrR family transcriptional repressor of uid operon